MANDCVVSELQMQGTSLSPLGAALLPAYLFISIAIGWVARRRQSTAASYLNASRSLPLWIVSASFLSANCGALEIIGLSAMAAEYGVQALQFYWIGAIPAMIFVALWMIPVYMKSGVESVPEYLQARFSPNLRLLNACITAIVTLVLAGISLYAMAQVLQVVLGLGFWSGIVISAAVVFVYALLGGVRATIFNEVLQLAVILAGLIPLLIHTVMLAKSPPVRAAILQHLWENLPLASTRAPMDVAGVVAGLGFVLSFSYWGTDFVLMQRTLASRSLQEARQVPLWAGFGKLAFSMIVVLPGLAASRVIPGLGTIVRFDQALPAMMKLLYSPAMLGLGLTAIAASLMSGLAANMSAFAAVWTEDIYRTHLIRGRPERHYLRMGYAALCFATLFSIGASSLSFLFGNLMEQVQLVFSLFGAPFLAIFLLGMASKRTTATGALTGFLSGAGVALLHQTCVWRHWISYGSIMSSDFHAAIYAFTTSLATALLVSRTRREQEHRERPSLVFHWSEAVRGEDTFTLLALAALLLGACIALNVIWR